MPGPSGPKTISHLIATRYRRVDMGHRGKLQGLLRTIRRLRRKRNRARRVPDPVGTANARCYGAQAGSPSPADGTTGFVAPTPMPHDVFASCVWLFVAVQVPEPTTIDGAMVPVDALKPSDVRLLV